MKKDAKIYVAGHTGLVGSAIVRSLKKHGYTNILCRTHDELDLTDQRQTYAFFEQEKPEYVYLAAAKVGGIEANRTMPAEFSFINQMIQCNAIHAAYLYGVKKLLFLGSSCIYPKMAPQPIKEEYLLTGPLEPTNEAYALAKINGLRMCQYYKRQYGCNFISCMPTNLYGPGDNYDLRTSHVLPALLRKIHEAKEQERPYVEIWGTGKPLREFMYVDDMADACVFLMERYDGMEHVNIGTGEDISIRELAQIICEVVGYRGELKFNTDMPDGTPRKLLDVTRLHEMGWRHTTGLVEGIRMSYRFFLEHQPRTDGE
jgi:GDP-L-fucose synthase